MKWTCKRCGLQRDDRRGSNCNGVPGQAHDWEETREMERRKEEEAWEQWINSSASDAWKKEFENIKEQILDDVAELQKQCIQAVDKVKIKHSKAVSELNKSKEEYQRKEAEYKRKEAEYKRNVEIHNNTIRENQLIEDKIIPIGEGLWKTSRLIIAGIGVFGMVALTKSMLGPIVFLLLYFMIPGICRFRKNMKYKVITMKYKAIIENNSVRLQRFAVELNENSKDLTSIKDTLTSIENTLQIQYYDSIDTIKNEYEPGIEIIIQQGREKMIGNNQTHNVDKGLFYKDKYEYDTYRNMDNYIFRNDKFREFYVNDSEFVREYNRKFF
jgi:hypothetical protein